MGVDKYLDFFVCVFSWRSYTHC